MIFSVAPILFYNFKSEYCHGGEESKETVMERNRQKITFKMSCCLAFDKILEKTTCASDTTIIIEYFNSSVNIF